jgi:hypothetical protein
MSENSDDLPKIFKAKTPELVRCLQEWFTEEAASIDDSVEAEAPSGTGGSIITVRPAIDSKRVLDATCVTEEVLGIKLPPKIIKPGGYVSCEEMVGDLIPKLEQIFIGGAQADKKIKVTEHA